jgi:uncharacterized protein (TIGR00251 family)
MIEQISGGVLIKVYVSPRASSNKVVGEHNDSIKIALTAPPVEGAANKALVEFVAKVLGVPKGNVIIIVGETSRNKTLRVDGLDRETAARKLGAI